MNKTTYTPNAPNILGCTCGFGLWLKIDGDWEHYTPNYRESRMNKTRRYHLVDGRGYDCHPFPDQPVPEYGGAIREHVDGAGNWLINFEGLVVHQYQLVDGAFVSVELAPPPF